MDSWTGKIYGSFFHCSVRLFILEDLSATAKLQIKLQLRAALVKKETCLVMPCGEKKVPTFPFLISFCLVCNSI